MRSYMFIILAAFGVLFVSSSFSTTLTNNEKKSENDTIARIVVLDFLNKSNLNEYQYISAGLLEAVLNKFNKRFIYQKINIDEVRKSLQDILQKSERKWYQTERDDIKALSEKKKLDVVIYGEYVSMSNQRGSGINRIKISTKMYLAFNNEEATLSSVVSKVDNSLPVIIDKIAQSSVENINKIVRFKNPEQDKTPVIIVPISQNLSTDEPEEKKQLVAELQYMRSQLGHYLESKVFFIDHYLRQEIDVGTQTLEEKKRVLSTLVQKKKISQMINIAIDTDLLKVTLISRGKPREKIVYPINAHQKKKYKHAEKMANFFRSRNESDSKTTQHQNSPILILSNLNNSSKDGKQKEQINTEIATLQKAIHRHYGVEFLLFSNYLKKDIVLKMSLEAKKKILRSLIQKYRIHKFLRVKMQSGLVKTNIVVNNKSNDQVAYDVTASNEIKEASFQRIAYALGSKKHVSTNNGRIVFKIPSSQAMSLRTYQRSWKNVAYEIGLNPFYQFSYLSPKNTNASSLIGGGLILYSRLSFNQIWRMFTKSNNHERKLKEWSRSFHLGVGLTLNYIQNNDDAQMNFFQNYIFSLDLSYLYPLTDTWRLGIALRPGFYFGYIVSKSKIFENGSHVRNVILPVILEASYILSQSFILNVGLSENLYDLISGSGVLINFTHGITVFLGVSWSFD